MCFPFDDEFEKARFDKDWPNQPKKMIDHKNSYEKLKTEYNQRTIKAVRHLLHVVRDDIKSAARSDIDNKVLINELVDVNWWLIEKYEELLIESGEDIS